MLCDAMVPVVGDGVASCTRRGRAWGGPRAGAPYRAIFERMLGAKGPPSTLASIALSTAQRNANILTRLDASPT